MTTIYKYPLHIVDRQVLSMPSGARILTAMLQGDDVCLWAEVEPGGPWPPIERTIRIIGTGHSMPDTSTLRYINSVIHGRFVWHVYEEANS